MHRAAVAVALLMSLWPAGVCGECVSEDPAGCDERSSPSLPESERDLLAFPAGHLYALPIADPHRPGAAINVESYTSAEVEGVSDRRYFLRVGGRFGLLRWLPRQPDGRLWQLSLEAGLDAQFDIDLSQDSIGWDGNYGLSLTTARRGGRWAGLIGLLHTSAHVGDEWMLRTGRERINYTREEARAAISWRFVPRWRTYAEAAYGYKRSAINNLMKPLRGQWGLEVESPGSLWNGLAGWYGAVDLQVWEERDWRLDAALQTGLMFNTESRVWRLGLQYHDGRVPLGEFFRDTESAISIGLWSEL